MKPVTIIVVFLFVILTSCEQNKQKQNNTSETPVAESQQLSISDKVDNLDQKIKASTASYNSSVSLDHHRMAKEEGAYTPPAIVTIFSDAKINSSILSNENQLIGLDLPFKVLCYSEPDTTSARLAYTSAEFIAKRHDISIDVLAEYSVKLNTVLNSIGKSFISETNTDSVFQGFGIVSILSDFDFETTVKKLTEIVHAQSDTRWFGEIDYQSEAKALGKELNPTTILFFGGPAPGAKAMMTTPKIGLDAFCQKLLVFENEQSEVWVAFNDIVAFSKLYYGMTTKPQQGINQRLIKTFTKVVQKTDD